MREADACADDLRALEIFSDLEEEHLDWLVGQASCLELEAGDAVWSAGQPADAMFVLLDGRVQLRIEIAGQTRTFEPHQLTSNVFGLLPYSRMTEFQGRNVALETARVLRVDKKDFAEMLYRMPELGARLVAIMSDRIRGTAVAEQQREKMVALGKLTAGLAHELNNPAAALKRAAADLGERLTHGNALSVRLARHRLSAEQMGTLAELRQKRPGDGSPLSALERGEREDDFADWLDDHGIDDGGVLAEALVTAGWSEDGLRDVLEDFPEEALGDAVAWVGSGLAGGQILSEVAHASAHIADLVGAFKSYSHMDQNPERQLADVHRGLDITRAILGHKFKRRGVTLHRHYDTELPEIPILVSELNQVWTNLLDNALDAVEDGGEISVTTQRVGDWLVVQVHDNGSGIPAEIQGRIFEPFYTTKGVGEGTGLGLDIVQRIVVQHGGEITIESQPGDTTFTVRLPIAEDC